MMNIFLERAEKKLSNDFPKNFISRVNSISKYLSNSEFFSKIKDAYMLFMKSFIFLKLKDVSLFMLG